MAASICRIFPSFFFAFVRFAGRPSDYSAMELILNCVAARIPIKLLVVAMSYIFSNGRI